MATEFYAYLWLREDGTPYYAGKGSGDRAFRVKTHKVNPPAQRSRIILYRTQSEQEAFDLEMTLIAWFGRKSAGTGCLRNFTSGGEGRAGYQISVESRRRMGLSQRGNKNSVAYKQSAQGRRETSELMRGNTFWAGRAHTPETRAKMSVSSAARGRDEHGRFLVA